MTNIKKKCCLWLERKLRLLTIALQTLSVFWAATPTRNSASVRFIKYTQENPRSIWWTFSISNKKFLKRKQKSLLGSNYSGKKCLRNITHRVSFLQGCSIWSNAWCRESQPINKLAEIFTPISAPHTNSTIATGNQPQPWRGEGRMVLLEYEQSRKCDGNTIPTPICFGHRIIGLRYSIISV